MLLGAIVGILSIYYVGNFDSSAHHDRTLLYLWVYVMVFFTCIPAFAAWLAGFRLRRIQDSKKLKQWHMPFTCGLLSATLLQICGAIFLVILLVPAVDQLYADASAKSSSLIPDGISYRTSKRLSFRFNLIMWVFLTLPFTAIGATIFQRVTKFPTDTDLFE